ncbi:hypothetical protein B0H14DRAFT_3467940 [Mycena olivaceomarginata]|nr:hypothetical protein B0H14DRAFT_3467940 [Mycena olivaceomarginata]
MSPNICAWALVLTLVYLAMRYKKHAATALFAALLPLLGPIVLAWAVSNAWTDSARALTEAMITGTGAIGSITSRVLDFQPTPEPDTKIVNALNVSLAAVVSAVIAVLWVFDLRYNKRNGSDTFKYVL